NYEYKTIKLATKISKDNEILNLGNLKFQCIHIPGHTPGSIAYLLETEGNNILFAGDVPGIAINLNDGNIGQYVQSMKKLLSLNIDILCEGHENITKSAVKTSECIRGYMLFNETLNSLIFEDPSDKKTVIDLADISYELGWYDMALDSCNYLLEIDPDNTNIQLIFKKIKKHNPPEIGFIKRLMTQVYGEDV
ncbi:MAG: hypothetical protein ACW96X_03505, partial [Promethearchaeota archaeon]